MTFPASFRRHFFRAASLLALVLVAVLLVACGSGSPSTAGSPATTAAATGSTAVATAAAGTRDAILARAFADHTSGLEVEGEGTVQKLLSDDTNGERHQRFIVELGSGQTLLVAHNIDVAPRVPGLEPGDRVSFKGQYEWNAQGGTVHWTHLDPDGKHIAGWIELRGKKYQ